MKFFSLLVLTISLNGFANSSMEIISNPKQYEWKIEGVCCAKVFNAFAVEDGKIRTQFRFKDGKESFYGECTFGFCQVNLQHYGRWQVEGDHGNWRKGIFSMCVKEDGCGEGFWTDEKTSLTLKIELTRNKKQLS